jgi:hypothetical protein
MFRLGTLLFIPGYVTVTLYRVLASPQTGGGLILMIGERYFHLLMCIVAYETLPFTSSDDQHVSVVQFIHVSISNSFVP